jgi:arylsulfatase A-like enzyme
MRDTIQRCDEYLGYLLDAIDQNVKLKNNLHLILTSDHGMEQINATDKPMFLDAFVDVNKIKAFGTETVLNIFVNSRKFVFAKVSSAQDEHRSILPVFIVFQLMM